MTRGGASAPTTAKDQARHGRGGTVSPEAAAVEGPEQNTGHWCAAIGGRSDGRMRTTFRDLLAAAPGPLVMPGAHDAISARLIARAGFKAYFIGGFPLVGARYGLPDVGLAALGEIAAGVRDIMAACDHLPVLVDGDNGYGDAKTAVHVLHT